MGCGASQPKVVHTTNVPSVPPPQANGVLPERSQPQITTVMVAQKIHEDPMDVASTPRGSRQSDPQPASNSNATQSHRVAPEPPLPNVSTVAASTGARSSTSEPLPVPQQLSRPVGIAAKLPLSGQPVSGSEGPSQPVGSATTAPTVAGVLGATTALTAATPSLGAVAQGSETATASPASAYAYREAATGLAGATPGGMVQLQLPATSPGPSQRSHGLESARSALRLAAPSRSYYSLSLAAQTEVSGYKTARLGGGITSPLTHRGSTSAGLASPLTQRGGIGLTSPLAQRGSAGGGIVAGVAGSGSSGAQPLTARGGLGSPPTQRGSTSAGLSLAAVFAGGATPSSSMSFRASPMQRLVSHEVLVMDALQSRLVAQEVALAAAQARSSGDSSDDDEDADDDADARVVAGDGDDMQNGIGGSRLQKRNSAFASGASGTSSDGNSSGATAAAAAAVAAGTMRQKRQARRGIRAAGADAAAVVSQLLVRSPGSARGLPRPAKAIDWESIARRPAAGEAKSEEVRAFLAEALGRNFLFSGLNARERRIVIDSMALMEVPQGTALVEQGVALPGCFVVTDGQMDVIADGEVVDSLLPGTLHGELALLYAEDSPVTLRAAAPSSAYLLERDIFRSTVLVAAVAQHEEAKAFLRGVPLLSSLTDEQVGRLADACQRVTFAHADRIVQQGDPGNVFHIVASGRVRVVRERDSQPMTGRVSAAGGARVSNASGVASAAAHKTTASEAVMTVGSARSVHTADGDAALVGGADSEGEAVGEAEEEAEFTVDEDGVQSNELEVLQLGEGAFFGERALLSNASRAASVLAIGEVTTLAINRDTFTALLGPLKEIMEREHEARMEQEAAARLQLAPAAQQTQAACDGVGSARSPATARSATVQSHGNAGSPHADRADTATAAGSTATVTASATASLQVHQVAGGTALAAAAAASITPASARDAAPSSARAPAQLVGQVCAPTDRLPGQPDSDSAGNPHHRDGHHHDDGSNVTGIAPSPANSGRSRSDSAPSVDASCPAATCSARTETQLRTTLLVSSTASVSSGDCPVTPGASHGGDKAAVAIAWPLPLPVVVSEPVSASGSATATPSASAISSIEERLLSTVVPALNAVASPAGIIDTAEATPPPTADSQKSGPGEVIVEAPAAAPRAVMITSASGPRTSAVLMEAALGLPSLSRLQRSMPAIVTGASSRASAGDATGKQGDSAPSRPASVGGSQSDVAAASAVAGNGSFIDVDGVVPPGSAATVGSSFRDRKPPLAKLLLPGEQSGSAKNLLASTGSKGSANSGSLVFPGTATTSAAASVGTGALATISGRQTPTSARGGGMTPAQGGALQGLPMRNSPPTTPLASAAGTAATFSRTSAGSGAAEVPSVTSSATVTVARTATTTASECTSAPALPAHPAGVVTGTAVSGGAGALSGIAVLPQVGATRPLSGRRLQAQQAVSESKTDAAPAAPLLSQRGAQSAAASAQVSSPLPAVRSVPNLTVGLSTVTQAASAPGSLSVGALPLVKQHAPATATAIASGVAPQAQATSAASCAVGAAATSEPAAALSSGASTGAAAALVHGNMPGLDARRSPNARSSIVSRTAFFAAALPPIEELAPAVAPIVVPAGTTRRFSVQGASGAVGAAAPKPAAAVDGLPAASASVAAGSASRSGMTVTTTGGSSARGASGSGSGSRSAASLPLASNTGIGSSASSFSLASAPAALARGGAAGGAGSVSSTSVGKSAAAAAAAATASGATGSKSSLPKLSVSTPASASQAAAGGAAGGAAAMPSGPISPTSVAAIDALPRRERPEIRLSDLASLAVLGEGAFGLVRLVRDRRTGEVMALKAMQKAKIVKLNQQANVCSERRLLGRLRHPNILNLVQSFKDRDCVYLLTEACLGGDLFGCLMRAGGRLLPSDTRYYSAVVASVLHYMHALHVVYRDLKPENLLLDASGRLKVADLGFAKQLAAPDYRTFTLCGTPEYLAPELVQGRGHSFGVDWWALGILLFEMLSGYSPFHDESGGGSQLVIYKNILKGRFRFPPHVTDAAAMDLITQLLRAKPSERLGSLLGGGSDVLKHAFFARVNWEVLLRGDVRPPIKPLVTSATDTRNFDEATASLTEPRIVPYVDTGDRWDADF